MTRPALRAVTARTLCAALLAIAVLGATAVPAEAAVARWTTTDDFESTTWTKSGQGDYRGNYYHDTNQSRSGERFASLTVTGASSWGSYGRTVRVPGNPPYCTAAVAVDPFVFRPDRTIRITLEIINPADWTYVSLHAFTLTTSPAGYIVIRSGMWVANPSTVFFRVSVSGYQGGAVAVHLDDMTIACRS